MNHLTSTPLAAALLVCVTSAGLLLAGSSAAAPLGKADYKAAQDSIGNKYKADQLSCNSQAGNAHDICVEEAKGNERVAKAELELNQSPSDKNAYALRVAKADALYAVARQTCNDKAGNARDVCRKEATSAHVAATADAKVTAQTAAANATALNKALDARADAAGDKREANLAVALQKCDALAGEAKSSCVVAAKAQPIKP